MQGILVFNEDGLAEEEYITTYTLLYTAGLGGSLEGDLEQTIEHGAGGMPVEAIPNEGYHFVAWNDGLTDNPRIDTNVTADLEVEAEFAVSSFLLSLQVDPPGTGQVSGAGEYDFQEDITLTATPEEGYEFVCWTDEQNETVSDQETFVFIMPAYDITLTAHSLLSTHAVTFIIENEHGETIIDAVVTLDQTENPPGDYVFEDVVPGDYSYTVTAENYFDTSGEVEVIDQDITVTVVMELDDTGIAEAQTPEITIFPNPARSALYIESNIRISQIQLLDMLGQRVMAQAVNDINHELNVSGLKDGLYLIQVFTERGVKTLRVQIIK